MMEEYLQELIGKKFIIEHKAKEGKTYSVTEKGLNYLNKYSLIADFTESFGLN